MYELKLLCRYSSSQRLFYLDNCHSHYNHRAHPLHPTIWFEKLSSMPGLCNCSVRTSVFFFMIHRSRTKLTTFRRQTVTMSLHISMRYYPPASQKTLPPMCQKDHQPSSRCGWCLNLVTVITEGEMSLVHTFWLWKGSMKITGNGSKMLDHYFFGTVLGSSTWLFFSRTYFEDCRLPSRDLPVFLPCCGLEV